MAAAPASAPASAPAPTTPTPKQIHSLVLDTGPLIRNDPPVSALIAQAEHLYTLPSVIPEIRDPATRTRVETQLLPFVTLRSPRPESIKFVQAFARKTGDLAVLSRPDIEVLALGYELECERNHGDWRLRNTPGQKTLNGRPPAKAETKAETPADPEGAPATITEEEKPPEKPTGGATETVDESKEPVQATQSLDQGVEASSIGEGAKSPEPEPIPQGKPETSEPTSSAPATEEPIQPGEKADETLVAVEQASADSDSDEDGWITPSNLKKHQAHDAGSAIPAKPLDKVLQAAVLTSDYAMQNVALRMNLNLLAPSLARITHLKNWVLRCHGCFQICKDMAKQFCPSCGQPTLTRTSCSTDAQGNFKVHLKKNYQWNNRGNVYSVPKPVHGSSNGRLAKHAGGQNNWGAGLILAEDQKEYTRASDEQRRARNRDVMDQDYLPDILTGHRSGGNGRINVGAGRNVNSKKKR